MKRTLGLICALMCLMACGARAAVPENVLVRAVDIIGEQESGHNYGLVITDTNGKISAGFLQWNAGRAVSLVRAALEASGSDRAFDGTLSAADKKWVGELLSSAAGRAAQDRLARSDVSAYIQKAMDLGITDPNALCYYCDIAHQVGSGAIVKYHKLAAEKAGGYEKVTLDILYQAALNYATHTKARRARVYKLLKEDPIAATPSPESEATGVSITPSGNLTVTMGETLTLKAVFTPENADEEVVWSSGNKKVATVRDGVVTPLRPGQAVIRVKSRSGLTARAKVTVRALAAEEIVLSGDASMKKGARQTLTATVSPAGASAALKWKSGNKKVARVSQSGRVTALRAGKAVVYCQSANGVTARFSITVVS